MHSTKVEVTRLREDLRTTVNEIMHEKRLVQKQLADALGVDQSTISRWLSYDGESDFPASLTPALTLQMQPLGRAILQFQADRMNLDVVKRNISLELNHTIEDEALDIVKYLGSLVDEFKTGGPGAYKKCRRQLEAIKESVNRAIDELNTLDGAAPARPIPITGVAK